MQPARSDTPATTSEEGYQQSLAGRQVQMIAIGGAIGVGLFYGTGARIAETGPALVLGFAVAGVVAFFVFAYAGTEMVGVTAGETRNVHRVIPKAINGVIWRIAIFYVGSVLLLVMVLPWTDYGPGQSPFVTVFAKIGLPAAASIMNGVVLIAALSSTNSGLYSTGRILRSLAGRGEAPGFTLKMSSRHVPYGGIMLTCAVYLLGVLLNLVVPHRAFDIATALASLGVISTWVSILVCHLRLRARADRGDLTRPEYRSTGCPARR